MAVERSQHQQWADEQVRQLIELGVNPIDAQESIDWILANLPLGADPSTYIFPSSALYEDLPEKMSDAAAAWMASDSVPNRFKRILHARSEDMNG